MNPLQQLHQHGQSFWLDNIRREFTRSGKLASLIENDGLRGVTSNPTIFQKAIADHDDYDASIRELVKAGKSTREIFEALAVEDIREACDAFGATYHESNGADGFVSIELPPDLARDTQGSIDGGRRLWRLVARPNVMIKVPATGEGLPVIRSLLAEGVNVNVTLMFGAEYYERVIDAFCGGLEDRLAATGAVQRVASVASCFVSRIDTEIDKRLQTRIDAGDPQSDALRGLLGKAAIANAKRLYSVYLKSIGSDRWKNLAAAGARTQRPLWASTSTKNPAYPDTYYVEALIGRDTVDTMPPATIDAFRDHGKVADTLAQGLDEAERTLARLEAVGISIKEVTDKLLVDGVESFSKSFDELLADLAKKATLTAASAGA